MQRIITLLALAFLVSTAAYTQGCLPGGLVLTTQAQVNSFPQDHPGCTTIEGYLQIGPGAINNLAGLSQIVAVDGYLQIGANPQLTSLAGMENLNSVGGRLGITGNAQLSDISALGNVTAVGGTLEISTNNNLISLQGLGGITSVGGELEITESLGLTNLQGLEGIQTIGQGILINDNPALATMQGLSPTSVGGGFSLMNNPQLMDLSAASELTSLGGVLSLNGNTSILSLQELSGITSINGVLRVSGGSGLMSLDGLQNIDGSSILNLIIVNNPGLFQCAVESLCNYLAIPASMANITGNATGCASRAEVEDACVLLSMDGTGRVDNMLSIFPNPSTGQVQLKFEGRENGVLNVFDMAGRSVHEERIITAGESDFALDLSHLPPGIYALHLQGGDQKFTTRLVRH